MRRPVSAEAKTVKAQHKLDRVVVGGRNPSCCCCADDESMKGKVGSGRAGNRSSRHKRPTSCVAGGWSVRVWRSSRHSGVGLASTEEECCRFQCTSSSHRPAFMVFFSATPFVRCGGESDQTGYRIGLWLEAKKRHASSPIAPTRP